MSVETSASQLDAKTAAFQRRFLMVTAGFTACVVTLLFIAAPLASDSDLVTQVGSALIGLFAAITLGLAYTHRIRAASYLFIGSVLVLLSFVTLQQRQLNLVGFSGFFLLVVMAAFLIRPKAAPVGGAIAMVLTIVTALRLGGLNRETMILYVGSLSIFALSYIIMLFAREAHGNLGFLRRRLENNDNLFSEVPDAANRLGAAASEILAMTEQQTHGTLRQASAIEETRQVLQSVSQASAEIVTSARETLGNAKTTVENSERVAENVRTLSEHTRDISRILDLIKDVANKSDLLALNAALEGTKAGEAGRGFSLVATQMQRLAENITVSVKDIKELTRDIGQATATTQLSMEEATKLARATTAASEQITLITQQQRTSVEQVTTAMDDIATITNQVASGTDQTISSTGELMNLAQQLTEVVEKHQQASDE